MSHITVTVERLFDKVRNAVVDLPANADTKVRTRLEQLLGMVELAKRINGDGTVVVLSAEDAALINEHF